VLAPGKLGDDRQAHWIAECVQHRGEVELLASWMHD
jgi:hypothetical protein